MDRYRHLLARVPGLSFIAAAALTVALEAAIGIGASISLASGLPSVTPPHLSGITSGVGSTVSSATSGVRSTVSGTTGAATGAASTAVHTVTSTASNGEQTLVNTASNLPSSATSTAGSTTQAVTSTAGGSSAPAGSSSNGSPGAVTAASTRSGAPGSRSSGHSSAGQSSSGARGDSSNSGSQSRVAQHQWFVRHLVTRLSGCVGELPGQSQQVLVLAAGIGSGQPNSPSRVAHILHISVSREERMESSAVASLQQAARTGSCQASGAAVPVSAVALGLQPGLTLITGPQAGSGAFLPAAQAIGGASAHKSAVRALRIGRRRPGGGSAGTSRVEKSAIGAPSGSSISAWIFVLFGLLAGAGFLVIGRQRLRARPGGTAAGAGLAAAGAAEGAGLAAAGAAGAATIHPAEPPASGWEPDMPQSDSAAAAWDPPAWIVPVATAAAESPAGLDPYSPAPLTPDAPESAELDAAAFVPEGFIPTTPSAPAHVPEDPAGTAPESPARAPEGLAPPASVGRPRVRAGRNWLRRHRQAAAMVGAVAGATLALMVSTASRSARLISRRRRRRHR